MHVVKRGETLSGIFEADGWRRVVQLNNLASPILFTPASGSATGRNHRGLRHHAGGRLHHQSQGETYGYFHRNNPRIRARGADRAHVRAGIQEIHPQRIHRTRPLAVSILFGTIAIAATGGFDGTYTWGIVLTRVVGVAQIVYTLVNQAFDGNLSKDKLAR